jgi:hypothetical protein
MNTFNDREAAAEALYIHETEAAAADRIRRIRQLGHWACKLMQIAPDDEARYLDLLYRLATSKAGDQIIVDRVSDDISAAGVSISKTRVNEVLMMTAADHGTAP